MASSVFYKGLTPADVGTDRLVTMTQLVKIICASGKVQVTKGFISRLTEEGRNGASNRQRIMAWTGEHRARRFKLYDSLREMEWTKNFALMPRQEQIRKAAETREQESKRAATPLESGNPIPPPKMGGGTDVQLANIDRDKLAQIAGIRRMETETLQLERARMRLEQERGELVSRARVSAASAAFGGRLRQELNNFLIRMALSLSPKFGTAKIWTENELRALFISHGDELRRTIAKKLDGLTFLEDSPKNP